MLVVLKERIHESVPTAKTIHILFHEQAVCKKGAKEKKGYWLSVGDITTVSGRVRDNTKNV